MGVTHPLKKISMRLLLTLIIIFSIKLNQSARGIEPDLQERVRQLEEKLAAQESKNTLDVYWKEGVRLNTRDGAFKLKLGVQMQADWAFFNEDNGLKKANLDTDDSAEFRLIRPMISGTIHDQFDFKIQVDLAGSDVTTKDVFLGMSGLPLIGNIRLGHFKEPFSLEELTGTGNLTFFERSLPNAYVPGRNLGLMIFDNALDEQITWATGIFRDFDEKKNTVSGDGEYNYTARLTALPYFDEDEDLIHLGIAYSFQNHSGKLKSFSARPEQHSAKKFVDTGNFAADEVQLFGVEGAFVFGSATLQSEYIMANANAPANTKNQDATFKGFYVYGSYFLTGEKRRYKKSTATFDRIIPKQNFTTGKKRGPGAWELAARYSSLDLNDANISGGELDDFTLGINWYLNPNIRLAANYILANLDDRGANEGDANIFALRCQLDF